MRPTTGSSRWRGYVAVDETDSDSKSPSQVGSKRRHRGADVARDTEVIGTGTLPMHAALAPTVDAALTRTFEGDGAAAVTVPPPSPVGSASSVHSSGSSIGFHRRMSSKGSAKQGQTRRIKNKKTLDRAAGEISGGR